MCVVLRVCVFVWDLDSPIRKEGFETHRCYVCSFRPQSYVVFLGIKLPA